MQRFWQLLLDARTLAIIGLLALAAFLFVGADALKVGSVWAAAVLMALASAWGAVWWIRRRKANQAALQLEGALDAQSKRAIAAAPDRALQTELAAVRHRMNEAVRTIKSSKLGQVAGSAALYQLPWYAVIGNPAAGKSSAVVRSGLNFPFTDENQPVLRGIGGTRNCDWFFTTEGILLDTAGRYSVHEEDRDEWLGFLDLLKRYRSKAPLNGVIIAASVAELSGHRPEFAIGLAKQLRQRVQELTERLEIFAPVYVMFTKADLIPGFVEFFEDRDPAERERVWGATLPYQTSGHADVVDAFDRHFDELNDGLKEASVARMSLHRGEQLPPGVLTFPLEFSALKPQLRTFIATLFEENPFQFRPVFRGFYFTSALQEGHSSSGPASQRVAHRFSLNASMPSATTAAVVAPDGFFLRDLFSKVIFADSGLVQQYASPAKLRLRQAAFLGGALVFGLLLAGWTWSYHGNQQLVADIRADLDQAVKLQEGRVDLQSRLEALEILQDRVAQLQKYRTDRPWGLRFGMYQGQTIEAKLRKAYLSGLENVMLKPTGATIATYLAEVNANADKLQPLVRSANDRVLTPPAPPTDAAPAVYVAASSTDVGDAYNALKTYIMLSDHERAEASHLGDQMTRFWRSWLEANRGSMPREQLIQSAEHILSFALTQVSADDFPVIQINLATLDTTRENLRRVVKGMPARERVYAEIKARAATRFPPFTINRVIDEADRSLLAGSYAISGAFTREAWEGFVDEAINEAATKETKADDWVLKTATNDDLTLEGSPQQIRKVLVQLYKAEYVLEWQKFMQGVSVKEFGSFDAAVKGMDRLGDPVISPVGKLIQALYDQTSWDNPSLLNEGLATGQKGFTDWFKQTILRMAPASVPVNVDISTGELAVPMGPIGKEFSGLGRIMVARDNGPNLLRGYLGALSKVRTKFNQMKNQGDTGPSSRQLMQQTLDGTSELSEALKLVDEQLLATQTDAAKNTLRPILVRPLMQAFAVIVPPAEGEINRVWVAQVHGPFQQNLAGKYPFAATSRVEATPAEIAKVFGPEGSIAKFSEQSLASLVVRRGDVMAPRTWADMGLRLRPELSAGFPQWVAPLSGAAAGAGGGGSSTSEAQTHFQILPVPATGLLEYTVEIDGQQLRYRNGTATWTNFVWPGTQGAPGVRITGTAVNGQALEFLNVPGKFGLEKMFSSARQRKLADGTFELAWSSGPQVVTVRLRLIASPTTGSPGPSTAAQTPGASTALRQIPLPGRVVGPDQPAGSALAMTAEAKP